MSSAKFKCILLNCSLFCLGLLSVLHFWSILSKQLYNHISTWFSLPSPIYFTFDKTLSASFWFWLFYLHYFFLTYLISFRSLYGCLCKCACLLACFKWISVSQRYEHTHTHIHTYTHIAFQLATQQKRK